MKGKMFIFTAPSGAGKTTVVRHLLDKYKELDFSISAATREKRAYEIDGKDYYFMSVADFKQKINEGAFVEWEEVYANQFYGTLKSEVERIWQKGKHIIFDIDVKGAKNIKAQYGDRCMAVFVRPPSYDVLVERLTSRNTESVESLKMRIEKVKREMVDENSFDMVVVNDVLDITLTEADHIVETFIYGIPKA